MGYTSPYGQPRGLRARLVRHRANLSSRNMPWHGTGIIDDVELIMQILDKREWLEMMRKSDDPDAQRFAAELLADDETLDAVQVAAARVRATLPVANSADAKYRDPGYDPVATVEHLDAAALEAQRTVRALRETLERQGLVDASTPDDMLADMLGVLFG